MRTPIHHAPLLATLFPTTLAFAAPALALFLRPAATQAQQAPVHHVLPILDADKPIFGQFVNYIGVGSDRESAVAQAANRDFDFVVYDLEHVPFDVPRLTSYLQWLLDRRTIAESGLTATKTVFVRMPFNARERSEWLIKQVLDQGVHGLVFPHTETVDQVLHLVRAMRYPQPPDAPDFEPEGIRGFSPSIAARYWGLSTRQYQERADIWKLDPAGSLIPIFIIENRLGVENVREIARTLREMNIGAILWAGSGDLRASYVGDMDAVAAALDTVIAAGRDHGIPVAINGTNDVVERVAQGVRMFVAIGAGSEAPPPEVRAAVGR